MSERRIKRWHVAAAIALTGLAVAVAVQFLARSQRAQDRTEILRWERVALPHILRAEGTISSFPEGAEVARAGTPSRKRLIEIRAALESVHRALTLGIPAIAKVAAGDLLSGVGFSLEALRFLEETQQGLSARFDRASYEAALAEARRRFARGTAALKRLE